MKKTLCVLLTIFLLLIVSGCVNKNKIENSSEKITLFPAQSEIDSLNDAEDIRTAISDTTVVNKTYGEVVNQIEKADIVDTMIDFRSENSYKFEQTALDYCKNELVESLQNMSELSVKEGNIWNCMDDGKSVYYSVHLMASYKVASGQIIERGFFYDVGVDTKTGKPFDASDVIEEVSQKYFIFNHNNFIEKLDLNNDNGSFADAAEHIAKLHLKHPDDAVLQSCDTCDFESTSESVRVFQVSYKAMNDYNMRIACLTYIGVEQIDKGIFREVDPEEYGFEKTF